MGHSMYIVCLCIFCICFWFSSVRINIFSIKAHKLAFFLLSALFQGSFLDRWHLLFPVARKKKLLFPVFVESFLPDASLRKQRATVYNILGWCLWIASETERSIKTLVCRKKCFCEVSCFRFPTSAIFNVRWITFFISIPDLYGFPLSKRC